MTGPPVDPQALVLATSELYGHGIYLGSSLTARDTPVFARPEDGVLLLGPPRSGKTAAVVVPNVLAACGPVIAASTKADVLASTVGGPIPCRPCPALRPQRLGAVSARSATGGLVTTCPCRPSWHCSARKVFWTKGLPMKPGGPGGWTSSCMRRPGKGAEPLGRRKQFPPRPNGE